MALVAGTVEENSHLASAPAEVRIHALDGLRAAAMFLGIVLHAVMSFTAALPFEGVSIDRSRHWGFDVVFTVIHGFRMHLFFLLAGFFGRLTLEKLGMSGFARQRWKRVGLPFVLGMVTIMPVTVVAVLWQKNYLGQSLKLPEGIEPGLPPMHLWFLEYLLLLYVCALAVAWVVKRLPSKLLARADAVFVRVIRSPWRVLLLAAAMAPFLWNGPWWGEPRPPAFNVKIFWDAAALYGGFFVVGWWLQRRRECLEKLKSFVAPGFVLGLAALAAEEWLRTFTVNPANPREWIFKAATLYCAGLYAWLMTFASMGWFLRHAGEPRSWVRYVADASYWCYLAHLPLVMFLQTIMARWPLPGLLKVALILAVTMAILMATYHWRVRYTWVGRMLNGPRQKSQSGVTSAATN